MKKIRMMMILVALVAMIAACGDKAPDTPDGVVKGAIEAVKNNEPGKIWVMLPESYQKDVQDMFVAAAGKIDAETYDNMMKAVDKLVAGLEKHKDKLVKAFGEKMPKGVDADKALAQVKALWGAFKAAGLNTHAGLKGADIGKILSGQGKDFLVAARALGAMAGDENPFAEVDAMIKGVKVEVKETKETTAIVKVTMGDKTEEVPFVKVEDKWIPTPMQAMWKPAIEKAKKDMEKDLGKLEKKKDEMKEMSKKVLEAATKFEETGDIGGLMALGMGM